MNPTDLTRFAPSNLCATLEAARVKAHQTGKALRTRKPGNTTLTKSDLVQLYKLFPDRDADCQTLVMLVDQWDDLMSYIRVTDGDCMLDFVRGPRMAFYAGFSDHVHGRLVIVVSDPAFRKLFEAPDYKLAMRDVPAPLVFGFTETWEPAMIILDDRADE